LAIENVIYKSPLGPPFTPCPPCPGILIVCPFSIPAGIVILMDLPFTVNVCLWVLNASSRSRGNSALKSWPL